VSASLRDLLAGTGGGARSLLHNCRFEGAGASAFGREAILEILRAEARSAEFVQVLEGSCNAALFASDVRGSVALFTDQFEGHITRLWYLAPNPLPKEQAERLDVPHDANIGQLTPRLEFDARDHPQLAPFHEARVNALILPLLEPGGADRIPLKSAARLTRLRPFVLRAFSAGDAAAVLIMMIALRNDGQAGLVQFAIAAHLPSDRFEDATVVVDEGQCDAELARSWRPVL
jgi:hypothetical protein